MVVIEKLGWIKVVPIPESTPLNNSAKTYFGLIHPKFTKCKFVAEIFIPTVRLLLHDCTRRCTSCRYRVFDVAGDDDTLVGMNPGISYLN